MHTLQIRNIPEELFEKIKKSAEKSIRSLTQQAIVLLDQALSTEFDEEKSPGRIGIVDEISRNRKLTKEEANLAIQWIREDRNR